MLVVALLGGVLRLKRLRGERGKETRKDVGARCGLEAEFLAGVMVGRLKGAVGDQGVSRGSSGPVGGFAATGWGKHARERVESGAVGSCELFAIRYSLTREYRDRILIFIT